jgi:hypothetical protein
MKEADYRNALDRGTEPTDGKTKIIVPESTVTPSAERDAALVKAAAEDYQLQRALDLLKGLSLYSSRTAP